MPPRRSHKKSKAGCQRCKVRKIKAFTLISRNSSPCDEVHPVCGNCSKHGVSCDFEGVYLSLPTPAVSSPSIPGTTTSTLGSSGNTPSASPSSPRPSSALTPFHQTPRDLVRTHPAASRLLELRLMHHFTAKTCLTFSEIEAARHAWQVEVPEISYHAQYLMDAILAVSALHLRAQNPTDQDLVRASHRYMASSIAQYSSLLDGGLSELNAEALFSTSALIAFQTSASRRFEDFQGDGGYTLPLAWFHSFQGVKTVVMASWQWLRQSNRVSPIINGQPALHLDLDPYRKLFFAPLLEGIDQQIAGLPEHQGEAIKQAYEHSVAFLNWAHLKPSRSRILGFAAIVSRRFVELLGLHDPRTLVIVSCFFAQIRAVDNVWWLHGLAKREVNGICSLLPSVWWPKMEWALRIANHEGPVTDDIWGTHLAEIKIEEENFVAGGATVSSHIDILASIIETYAPPGPPD
ncbi:Sterol uptake control protein [Lachnellula willkommii]|uniref:Sterol uptake control protein n=1 Tax=Lachnellula willkommii TaxID=215461 RepID=A0A559M620_9HELO|nr:Sterol uptake control protein [Lachnellula willkommii]